MTQTLTFEIYATNGYLPDQFLQTITNNPMDLYGCSVENHAHFMLEITKAVVFCCIYVVSNLFVVGS